MNVFAAIFINQRLAISREKHAQGICHQEYARGDATRKPEETFFQAGDVGVAEIHMLHQMMQRNVSVIAAQTQERGRTQAEERRERMVGRAVRREYEIEPDDVGIDLANFAPDFDGITQAIEFPATNDVKAFELFFADWMCAATFE